MTLTVRRLRRRGHSPDPHAVYSQSLRDPDHPTPHDDRPVLRLLLQRAFQELDPIESVDALDFARGRNNIYAFDILEEEELSHEHRFLGSLHGIGGILNRGHYELLPKQDCLAGAHFHLRHLRLPELVRLPDEI